MSLVSYELSDNEEEIKDEKLQKNVNNTDKDSKNPKMKNRNPIKILIPPILVVKEDKKKEKLIHHQNSLLLSLPPPKTVHNDTITFSVKPQNKTDDKIRNHIFSKLKKSKPDMLVVDVNDLMLDKETLKNNILKEESFCNNYVQEIEEPSFKHRKKHQITYLAYQAKLNEEKLKNQWAFNRMTRKQTQAKYGF